MATIWEKDLGVSQGRIPVAGAPDGTFVFELGHALRVLEHVNVGDFHEVEQTVVFDSQTKLVRVTVNVVPPDSLPTGHFWEVTLRLNGTVMFTRRLIDGRLPVELVDMAIPLTGSNGPPATDDIAVRLELVN